MAEDRDTAATTEGGGVDDPTDSLRKHLDATENEPADYIEEHAQEIAAKFLEVNGVR